MKHLCRLFLTVIFLAGLQQNVTTKSELSDVTPDPSVQPYSFPDSLYCSDIESPYDGLSWNNITIGHATQSDLENLMAELSENYHSVLLGDKLAFDISPQIASELNIPSVVTACVFEETILAIQLTAIETVNPLYLDDFVAEYGIPDVVTWTESPSIRIAFWFEKGVAAEINIQENAMGIDYGQVMRITYFPFQNHEGYEERWPYNVTRMAAPPEYIVYDPPLSQEQNPFDFEAMIATITAEPSRTPTPTFTPLSSTPTATAKP